MSADSTPKLTEDITKSAVVVVVVVFVCFLFFCVSTGLSFYRYVLVFVQEHKLESYEYVFRSSGLAKTMLQGTVKGGRRQGRQRKRWEYDAVVEIREPFQLAARPNGQNLSRHADGE